MNPHNVYRSEVETPNNENSKKNIKKNPSEEDMNKVRKPLKEGSKFNAGRDESEHKNNECSSNDEDKIKEKTALDHQHKNHSDDKKKETIKMECDVSKSVNINSNKVCDESNINLKKNIDPHQNIKGPEYVGDKARSENNSKKVFEDSDKSSKSSKKKKTKASLLDQQNQNSSLDEKIDCEMKHINKINDDIREESLFNHKSQNNSDEKLKCKISNLNTKLNKKDERKRDKSSDSREKETLKWKDYGDRISKINSDKIKQNCYELETMSNNYKQDNKFKNDIRNQSSKRPHKTVDDETKKIYNKTKNYECLSDCETESFLNEVDEDLFALPVDFSLAHCVAKDLRMGAGIAVDFKKKFGSVGKLIDQKLKVGEVGIVNRHDRYVFYLITKPHSRGKPTMLTLKMALESLLSKMKELRLTKLGIPKIGCGLDELDWSEVKSLIVKVFSGSGIAITACLPSKLSDRKPTPPPLNVYITRNNLWEMEAQTDIIILIDLEKVNKNDWTDYVLNKVNVKYPFKEKLLKDVKNKKLKSGEILLYEVQKEKIFCVFFEQKFFYGCVEDIFRANYFKSKETNYLAIHSGSFDSDDAFNHIVWIVLIFRSISSCNELWLCGVTEQKEYSLSFDKYCRNLHNSNPHDNSFSSPMSRNFKHDSNQSFHSLDRSFSSSPMSKNNNFNDNNPSFHSRERSSYNSPKLDYQYNYNRNFHPNEKIHNNRLKDSSPQNVYHLNSVLEK